MTDVVLGLGPHPQIARNRPCGPDAMTDGSDASGMCLFTSITTFVDLTVLN